MEQPTSTSGPMVAIDARKMRRRRQLQGLNQAALAGLAGLHRSHISHIEAGRRPTISPSAFARICDALDIEDRAELLLDEPVARAS